MLGDEWKKPLKASKDIFMYLGKSLGKEDKMKSRKSRENVYSYRKGNAVP